MVDTDTLEAPTEIDEQGQQPAPPQDRDDKLRALHTAVGKEYHLGTFEEFKQKIQDPGKRKSFYDAVGKQYDLGKYDDFEKKISGSIAQATPTTPTAPPPPEHEIQHTTLHDARHLQEMANMSVPTKSISLGVGASSYTPDIDAIAANKAYKDQYDKSAADLATQWGTKPEVVKQTLTDFPDEQDENKLKGFASLAIENPVRYGRLKNANDIRLSIAKSNIQPGSLDPDILSTRPDGKVHENSATGLANAFNDINQATNFDQVEQNAPFLQQMIHTAGLSQGAIEKLKEAQRPFINSIDPGLLYKQWNGPDKELGLTADEYAGLQTELLFNPNKYQMDLGILKHARGIGDDGEANPLDLSKESYEYQRGVENVKYNLEQTGRENKARYVAEMKPDIDKQVAALKDDYQQKINNTATPQEQQSLIQDFTNHPAVQEANKLEDAAGDLQYSQSEDQRRYPLNFSDQATREVKEAMDHTTGFWGNVGHFGGNVLRGAGESADNTLRWIKNAAINIAGSEAQKSFNNAKNIGHQALTELSAYEPTSYTGRESPLNVPRGTIDAIQGIFKDPDYHSDAEREQHAIAYLRDHFNELTVNPKAGQQNLTGKAALFQAANVMGQILGVANQSFLLGGAIGDASKLQQMATAFTPMYMSTQNQMYEQALKNGDENPYAKSTVDAAIISLASLINPDIKVVKGMLGAETGLGKMIAGIDENTWNKVLSTNKPWVDRTIAAAKATGRQLGLANLQYGVIAPTAEYIAHKAILNEDANLGDMVKDGIIQTNISMALPALLHGVWGGVRATQVNPTQKYAIVEAGLHAEQNIDLVQSKIEKGVLPEIQGHEMKQLIKHSGEILQNTEMIKTDGTPMNENEVADTVYNMLRVRTLEGKMKTAAEPIKPIIEEKIHEINKDISDLHTSDEDKHKTELNQLLHDNLDRIRDKIPTMEQPIKDAIAENRPEDVFKEIASRAMETTKKDGVEVSSRPLTEEIFGKALVEKAIELSKQKTKDNGKTKEAEAGNENVPLGEQSEGAAIPGKETAPSISEIKNENHALQEPSAGSVFQHPQEGIGSEGSERSGVELSQQGEVPPQESGSPQAQQPGGPIPPKEINPDDLPFGNLPVGISHEAQIERAKAELNVSPPERGEGVTMEEAIQKGRDLIANGTDPEQVLADFKKTGKISMDDISVVRARYDQLAKATNEAYDKYGENSPEAKAAMTAEREWYNNAVKPMQTEWSKAGMAQQGRTDLDTGSVMAIRRAVKDKFDKELTPAQVGKAKEIVEKNKQLDKQVKELTKKLDDAHNADKAPKTGALSEKAKIAANAFRKLKTKEFTFKDSNGNDVPIQKMGISWNDLVEIGAKAIEKTGEIADGVAAIIDKVKEADWYKALSKEDKDRFENELGDHYLNISDKKSASRIKALEKQLSDLQSGNIKEKGATRTPTDREKELKDQIFNEKNKLGLIKSKSTPQPKIKIEQQPIAERFVHKTDEKFTPEEAKAIWEYTKSKYMDKDMPFPDALRNVATDLGLNRKQVVAAIATPKGAKEVTLEMYKKQYERTKAINSAKIFVETANNSKAKNFFNQLPSVFFNLKTYGHGTVGFITHAGPNIFRPSVWKSYWPNFFKQFAFAYGNLGKYEMALDGLKNSDHFDEWKRSGLAVDPNESYDQYQMFGIKQSWLGEAGTRGFNALKFLRYDMAESFYKSASDSEKADPALRENIAELVNHATGHTEVKIPGKLAKVFFAPGLEISRWQRMITDPAMALNTLRTWNERTPAEQAAAKIVFKGAGEKLATYSILLAANAGLLAATGSKQKVNLDDPSKSDWLKFKTSDKTLDVTGGVLNPIRLLSVIAHGMYLSTYGDKKDLRTKPGDKDASTLASQVRYKLSPIAASGADVLTGTDAMGNPLPWSAITPPKGRHKIDWGEFATQQLPIPFAAGFKEVYDGMRERGMSGPQINDLFNGLLQFGTEGFTGAKLSPDYSIEKEGGSGSGGGAGGSFGGRTPRSGKQ